MTYIWAIITMTIVIGILVIFFHQATIIEYCSFSPIGTFTCESNPLVIASNNNQIQLTLKLRNHYREPVVTKEIICLGFKSQYERITFIRKEDIIAQGSTKTFENIPCKTQTNEILKASSNQRFTGQLIIKYRLESDPQNIVRFSTATIETIIAQKN